jgi:RimJ/RimL family protein N-acetyltransferase
MSRSLHTARLDLTAVQPGDVGELHEIFSDPRTHTIGQGPFHAIDQTQQWIARRIGCYRDLGLCWYVVREKDSGELVGNCGIFVGRTGPIEPEIGYEIRHDRQGRGYASEAAAAVITECAHAGLGRIWATVRPANTASLRVLHRIGMTIDHLTHDDKGGLLFLSRQQSRARRRIRTLRALAP